MSQDGKARGEIRGPHIGEHFDDAPLRAASPCGRLVISTMTLSPSRAPCAIRGTSPNTNDPDPPARPGRGPSRAKTPPIRVRRIADAADQPRDAPPALIHADRQHLDAIVVHQRRRVGARQHQGAEPSSGITSTSPLARPRTRPATRSPSPGVANPFGPSIACPSRTIAASRLASASRCACRCATPSAWRARRGQGLGASLEREVFEQSVRGSRSDPA
jgi:hypothetical protein